MKRKAKKEVPQPPIYVSSRQKQRNNGDERKCYARVVAYSRIKETRRNWRAATNKAALTQYSTANSSERKSQRISKRIVAGVQACSV